MIEYCECEYRIDFQKFVLVYKLEGQKPEYLEITKAQMADPYKMNSILKGLVMLHRRDWDENL